MNLSEENAHSIHILLSLGLFANEEEAVNYATQYAFQVDGWKEISLEFGSEEIDFLQKKSEQSGVSIEFIINCVLKNYIQSKNIEA